MLMDLLTTKIRWYGSLIVGLGLPVWVAMAVAIVTIILFVYCAYDLRKYGVLSSDVTWWIAIIILVPLGTILYLYYGRKFLDTRLKNYKPPKSTAKSSKSKTNKTAITFGSVLSTLAAILGVGALIFFVVIVVVMIQCSRDPKCM